MGPYLKSVKEYMKKRKISKYKEFRRRLRDREREEAIFGLRADGTKRSKGRGGRKKRSIL